MTLDEFLKIVREELIETAPEQITGSTKFKELNEWSSLIVMILTTRLDEEFSLLLKKEALSNSITLEELYTNIKQQ